MSVFTKIRQILEMIRFSHTLFALPFALLAAVMAWRVPTPNGEAVTFRWTVLLGILLCMAFARSAAMVFNRIVDRDVDARNPRTAGRHIPSGILSVRAVRVFAVVMSIGFAATTLLFFPNWLPLALSFPVLAFLFGYSYSKRFTSLAHFWLGAALMLAPISAWIAVRGEYLIHTPADMLPAGVLGLAVMLWVAGFDVIYACQDVEFDGQAKLHSIPARWGVPRALRLAAACHFGMVAVLVVLPLVRSEFGWIYWLGMSALAILLVYEHWLVRPDDLTRVNVAFFQVNSIVSIGLFVVGSVDLFV